MAILRNILSVQTINIDAASSMGVETMEELPELPFGMKNTMTGAARASTG